MKKVVLKIELNDNKAKQKAMKRVSTISGIDSISMDMKEKKMTVIGEVDPVEIVEKLRKYWHTTIDSVGPPKGPEKKKEEPKKQEEKKKEHTDQFADVVKVQQGGGYYPVPYYYVQTVQEENPGACCVIS